MTYALPVGLANTILHYLGQRPYIEVAEVIAQIRQLEPIPEPQPDPAEGEQVAL